MEDIFREELKEKMDCGDDFVLVEALEEEQYEFAHLPGAINVPPGETHRAEELIPDKGAEVVVYCASPPWTKSEEAARELVAMGYTNVRHYDEGKKDWMKHDLPVEGERSDR